MRNLLAISALLFALATGAASSGCFTGTLPGQPSAQKLTMEASRAELVQAAVQHCQEQEGWTLVKSGKEGVVAVSAVDQSGGMMTRDKWEFRARDGVISAKLYLEFMEDGRWDSIDLVSQNYSYFREHEHLRLISKRAVENRKLAVR